MMKQNPAVDHQDVALEVPEGDLVDSDILKTSLYGFVVIPEIMECILQLSLPIYTIMQYVGKFLIVYTFGESENYTDSNQC